jgi:hypothetical protein
MHGKTLRLRADDLHWREVEGEVIALDIRESEYFAVNRSGAALWEAIAAGASERRLADLLIERFGVSEDDAAADARQFVADLERRGLVTHEE